MWSRAVGMGVCLTLVACGGGSEGTSSADGESTGALQIVQLTPEPDASNVSPISAISVMANRAFTNQDISRASFSLATNGVPVTGEIGLLSGAALFTPASPLLYATEYTASFSLEEDGLRETQWSFTTIEDLDPFTIRLTGLDQGNVVVSQRKVSLQLSAPLNTTNVTSTDFQLINPDGELLETRIYYDSNLQKIDVFVERLDYATEYQLILNNTWYSTDGKVLELDGPIVFTSETDVYAPEVYDSDPLEGEQRVREDEVIELDYGEALNASTLVKSRFTLRDTDRNIDLPFDLALTDDDQIVEVRPTDRLPQDTEIELVVAAGLSDLAGNTSTVPFRLTFRVEPDYQGPQVVSVTPAAGTKDLNTDTVFTVEFDEDLKESAIRPSQPYLMVVENDILSAVIETTTTVQGNILTITPNASLPMGAEYSLDLNRSSGSTIEDELGNRSFGLVSWRYETEAYDGLQIALGAAIQSFELDRESNKLFALDAINKRLLIVNLNTDTLEATHPLVQVPSRLCLDRTRDRLFMTNSSSSFITEYRLSDMVEMASIPWSAKDREYEGIHFDIACDADYLYVASGETLPGLSRIDREAPYAEEALSGIRGVADLLLDSTGDIYISYLRGSSSLGGVGRYREGVDEWMLIDESSLNLPSVAAAHLPLLFDELSGRLVHNQAVYNAVNLTQVLYDFGPSQLLHSADFTNDRVSTLRDVYSLTDFSPVMALPVTNIEDLVFDTEGDLYLLDNDQAVLFVVKEAQLSAAEE